MRAVLLAAAVLTAGCGGRTEWDRQVAAVRASGSDAVVLTSGRVTPDDLADLRTGCGGLRRLSFARVGRGPAVCDGEDFTANLSAALDRLPNLERLDFDGPLTLRELAGASPVTALNLPRADPDAAGLAALAAAFPKLRSLRVRGLRFDAGTPRLPAGVRHLHLLACPLTDAGVPALASLCGRLGSLYLDGSRLTPAGTAALADALPGVHLHLDGGHR